MAKKKAATAEPVFWPMALLVSVAPFCAGMFYEPFSALVSVCLIAWLFYCRKLRGVLVIRRSLLTAAVTVLAFFYALSALWAVDRGMAPIGFVKFLPLPLFVIACGQLSPQGREAMLSWQPYAAGIMTVLSLLLGLIPALAPYFYVNHRLAGFFQYPNTYALYAVMGVVLLAEREKWGVRELVCLISLLAGVALSGSRTVMVLLGAVVVLYAILLKDTRRRIVLIAAFALMLGAAALYARVSGDVSSAGRYLTTSAGSSTFLGRLLYYRDALPVILRHPLGLGYLGYWYTQGSFQTGVYSVMHIHNDFLQFLLDVGWAPTALLTWAVIRAFLRSDRKQRVLIGLMTAHLLVDFDLQFAAMDLLLLLVMFRDEGTKQLRVRRGAALAVGGVLAAVCLYFGTASGLYYLGQAEACCAVWPAYTPAQIQVMAMAGDIQTQGETAESILSHNRSTALAWDAEARIAYSGGDMARMIECKNKAIALNKYALSEYLDYADMLAVGLRMYTEAGDEASAAVCREELRGIPARLDAVREGTSALGWRISDKPELDLPEEYAWLLSL